MLRVCYRETTMPNSVPRWLAAFHGGRTIVHISTFRVHFRVLCRRISHSSVWLYPVLVGELFDLNTSSGRETHGNP